MPPVHVLLFVQFVCVALLYMGLGLSVFAESGTVWKEVVVAWEQFLAWGRFVLHWEG